MVRANRRSSRPCGVGPHWAAASCLRVSPARFGDDQLFGNQLELVERVGDLLLIREAPHVDRLNAVAQRPSASSSVPVSSPVIGASSLATAGTLCEAQPSSCCSSPSRHAPRSDAASRTRGAPRSIRRCARDLPPWSARALPVDARRLQSKDPRSTTRRCCRWRTRRARRPERGRPAGFRRSPPCRARAP